MRDRLAMLRNAVLLESVPDDELEQLGALVKAVDLKAAETFAVRGQPSPGMVLVDAGTLEVILDSTPIWCEFPTNPDTRRRELRHSALLADLAIAFASKQPRRRHGRIRRQAPARWRCG